MVQAVLPPHPNDRPELARDARCLELERDVRLELARDVRPELARDVRPELARDVRLELEYQDSHQVQDIYI